MYRRVMAFDYDGTLAREGLVPQELIAALEQCRLGGHALFLVTGRRFESVNLGPLSEVFAGVVWENGAVLAHTASGEIYLPFGQLDSQLVKAIEEAGIPHERGLGIVATWTPHDHTLWQVLRNQGSTTSLEYNKGSVMVLPPGATKGAGLQYLLTLCGFSARNLAAFGDAENDLSMLTLAEVGVAVGDAVPSVQEAADLVAEASGPQGVLQVLEEYPLAGQFLDIPLKRERTILLGQTDDGRAVTLPAARLAGRNLGVFGDSGTGKSGLVGLIAEGLHHENYQVLLIDPEGDFRGLRVLPRFISLSGDEATMPPPSSAVTLLDEGGLSLVVDLSQYPLHRRNTYLRDLFRALQPVRERRYRPHWIVLDEAQQFLFEGAETSLVAPLLPAGGWAFVSYRPDRIHREVLTSLHHCLMTRLTEPAGANALRQHCRTCMPEDARFDTIPLGGAMLCSGQLVRMRPAIRRVPHIRHLYKYLDVPLPPEKRFWFRDHRGPVGREAASLYEFLHLLPSLPIASLEYHDRRDDFVRWAESSLGDPPLASGLRKIANRRHQGEELRRALLRLVESHYQDLWAQR